MKLDRSKKRISKKANKGFQGYPVVTIAYYGPSNKLATKVAVGVIVEENGDAQMERFSLTSDVRNDEEIQIKIVEIIGEANAKSVSVVDGIIGCPHEEGIDYPDGEECPECEFWKGRDRFTGEYIQ